MNPDSTWPSEAEDRRLAAELVSNRASAGGEVAAAFLAPLAAYLRRRFRHIDPDLCEEAAGEAIVNAINRPEQYDPEQLTLGAFLRMAAFRDLLNRLPKRAGRTREISLESVAEPADRRNDIPDDGGPTWADPALLAAIDTFDPAGRTVLDMMRDGVRDTSAFVPVLGLSGIPTGEQAAAVKRYKDRLKKRLERAVRGNT